MLIKARYFEILIYSAVLNAIQTECLSETVSAHNSMVINHS